MVRITVQALSTLRRFLIATSVSLALMPTLGATYAWACQENAMLVFDASGSMGAIRDGLPKITTARDAAADVLPDVTRLRATGLVTYGGQRGPICSDVQLRIPPMQNSGELILAELAMMEPNGQTPLSDAVLLAAETLHGLAQPGIIVLVTDGLENCGYNACALGRKLRASGVKLRVHVIGFHLRSTAESRVACLSRETGGTYTSTNSLETLRAALKETLGCPQISRLPLRRLPSATRIAALPRP